MTPSYRALFAVEGFTRIVTGMLLGRVAMRMVAIVLVLFVLERYGSPTLAGLTTFLAIFPGLIVSPLAGALLDRHGRRGLIVIDHLVAGAAFALIALLALADSLSVPALLLIVTIASLTQPLSSTGMRTLFPLIVPRAMWDRANAIDSNGYALSDIAGPVLAGGLVAIVGGEGALIGAAAVLVAAAAVMTGVRDPGPSGLSGASVARDALNGLLHVAGHPTLRGIALSVSTSNLGHGIFFIAVPVLVLDRLGGSATTVGQLFALMGVAAFVSVLMLGRIGTESRERWLMTAGLAMMAVALVPAILAPSLATIAFAAILTGLAFGPYDIAMFALRQRRTDPAWFGRAFAVSMAVNYAGMPIGSAAGGVLTAVSAQLALAVSVAAILLGLALAVALIPREAGPRAGGERERARV